MKSGSNLEKILGRGLFAVTARLSPPRGNDSGVLAKKANALKGCVDAVNVTDNHTAIVRMSSMAASSLLIQTGLEPVMHVVTRDRNRIGMQSDILGATALGVKNILCLTGDHQSFGNQADSKNVHDLDSLQLIDCVRAMRDEGTLLGGEEKIEGKIEIFIGGAANPFGDPFEYRVTRLAKKIDAGIDFVQTQSVFDMNRFKEWLGMVRDRGLHEKAHIMASITPLQSVEMGVYINENIPGVAVPEALIDRLAKAQDSAEEGIRICVDQIEELKEVDGIRGIHLMTLEWEEAVGQIADMAGLLPRPAVS